MTALFRGFWRFCRQENFYAQLGLCLAIIYFVGLMAGSHREGSAKNAAGSEKFYKRAEANLQKTVEQAGSTEAYLERHPEVKRLFLGLSGIVLLLLVLGLSADALYLFSPSIRRRFRVPGLFENPPWPLSMLVKLVILFCAGALLLGTLTYLLAYRTGADPDFGNTHLILHATMMDLLALLLILYFVRKSGAGFRDIGFRIPGPQYGKEVLAGLGAYLAVLPLFLLTLVAAAIVAQLLKYEPPAHPLVEVFFREEKRAPALVVYSIFLAIVIGPCLEEIFFRGFLYRILRRRFGAAAGMVLSASFFALIHENSFAFWPIFVLGLALAYVAEQRRSIVACMVMHMAHNALFLGYFFVIKHVIFKDGGALP
jgi:membrane protease YdiL (CAAX protease family)